MGNLKGLAVVVGFIMLTCGVKAQCPGCVVDTTCISTVPNIGSICPDSMAEGTAGKYYEQQVTFYFPRLYKIEMGDSIPGIGIVYGPPLTSFLPNPPSTVIIDIVRVSLKDIAGLPAGLSWQCDSTNCTYTPGLNKQRGCLTICGNIPCETSGAIPLTFQFEYVMDGQDFLSIITGGVSIFPPGFIPPELPGTVNIDGYFEVNTATPGVLEITANKPNTIGLGESITLSSTSGFDIYAWSTGDSTSEITVSPNESTIYTLQAADSNGCEQEATFDVTVVPPSSIKDLGSSETLLHLFPNPGNGKFYIDGMGPGKEQLLTIYNPQGKETYKQKIDKTPTSSSLSLDLSYLPKGVYYVKLNSESSTATGKLIIE